MPDAGEDPGNHCSHDGASARAASANKVIDATAKAGFQLREHRKANLLGTDVMCEVFGRDHESVLAGGQVVRYSKLAGVEARLCIPCESNGCHAVHTRNDGSRGLGGAYAQPDHVAFAITRAFQFRAHNRRLARNDKGFVFAIRVSASVSQDELHVMRAVWSARGCKEAGLP